MYLNKVPAALVAAGLAMPGFALATNGMLMEGYGPIATGMGGASMAYDNGTAAMANNPATLGLMAEGSRLDVALGFLGPDVEATPLGKSKADAFFMPAFGYVKKAGNLTYGVGVYAQGGMGTDYPNGDMAQVGVGRLIFPVAYNVNERLTLGGSLDYVWAGMDLVYSGAGINFKDGSDYTGKANGYGIAAKLGFTYKVNDSLNVGGVYQTAGNLGDLSDRGYRVKDFDMPPTLALGLAWHASDKLMIAADIKDVMWDSSMNTVTIVTPGGDVPFQQDWDDQIVFAVGAAYKFNDRFTGRVGVNVAENPIPTEYMNYLWPAIVEQHYMLGFGYNLDKTAEVNFSLAYAPEVSQTHGVKVDHSQISWQLMYSKKF